MQHDLFKNITEIEKKYLKDWISLQTRFETKFSNKSIKGKAKQDNIDSLRLESDDFLGDMPLKLFVSDYFVKCLLEQKNSMLDGYLFLSKNLKNSEIIEKNEKFLFDSLKKIFTKITNKN